jgi:hypothetical protein
VVADKDRPGRVDVELHAADDPGAHEKLGELKRVQSRAAGIN